MNDYEKIRNEIDMYLMERLNIDCPLSGLHLIILSLLEETAV